MFLFSLNIYYTYTNIKIHIYVYLYYTQDNNINTLSKISLKEYVDNRQQ